MTESDREREREKACLGFECKERINSRVGITYKGVNSVLINAKQSPYRAIIFQSAWHDDIRLIIKDVGFWRKLRAGQKGLNMPKVLVLVTHFNFSLYTLILKYLIPMLFGI